MTLATRLGTHGMLVRSTERPFYYLVACARTGEPIMIGGFGELHSFADWLDAQEPCGCARMIWTDIAVAAACLLLAFSSWIGFAIAVVLAIAWWTR